MKLGLIGLGRMGGNMTKKLIASGHEVVVWNRSADKAESLKSEIKSEKLIVASSIEDLITSLRPRARSGGSNPDEIVIVWIMVPAGEATDEMLQEVKKHVEKNDIVIEGSNAHFADTERRYKEFTNAGIRFLGIGVSGGILGIKDGYPLMVGGDKSAYDYIIPIMDTLIKPKASHEYYGPGGAGHLVKMVHNAIEYAYVHGVGEGLDVLENAPYKYDLLKVTKQWQKLSLVSGFMMDRAVDALEQNPPHLPNIVGVIDATGAAQWTVEQAKKENVAIEVIEKCVEYRERSKTDEKIQASFGAKMIAAMRRAWGLHPITKK